MALILKKAGQHILLSGYHYLGFIVADHDLLNRFHRAIEASASVGTRSSA